MSPITETQGVGGEFIMNAMMQLDAENFDAAELGAMMREIRENLGHKLDVVASDLRIRLEYLEAIESGRLSDLPGNAYVSGFLRSYSDFLGLDGDEIVRRFKMAGAEISSQPRLHLPSPVEEGRLPTASILLVAAVIAAAACGGWYYLSDSGKGPVEMVAKLPKELSGLVAKAKNQAALTETADHTAAPSKPPIETKSEKTVATGAPAAPASRSKISASPKRAEVPESAPVPELAPAAASVVVNPDDKAVRMAAVSLVPPPAPAPSTTRDSAPTETASLSSAGPQSSSVGLAEGVRIVIRATSDSYVAVRTGNNVPLFSRLMRRGDIYEVPFGADLILETGNAGGLQISVGGRRVPSLGPIGEIRRNIELDAEKLLSGIN